jgi:pimeloyl-ACP methyl ester carboxylesterase
MQFNQPLTVLLLVLFVALCATAHADILREDYSLPAYQHQFIPAEKVSFNVPENRASSNSRNLTLGYVRLPALTENPGNPIVYLAGGPGGSATEAATYPRFVLFQSLRQHADVILFDQRGTGLSDEMDDCTLDPTPIFMQPLTEASLNGYLAQAIPQCLKQWQEKRYDLNGYTTKESALDLVELRNVLGAKKLDFLAISYGTHLALATAKYHPDIIGKMVLASSEGLDQTIKLPAESDKLLSLLNTRWKLQNNKNTPDLLSMMRQVHSKLAKTPELVTVKHPQTHQEIQLTLSELDLQLITSYSMAIKGQLGRLNPMAYAMDGASSISAARLKKVRTQSTKALLGRSTNLPFPDVNQWLNVKELDADFRAPFKSNLPALFLMGDRDGRTFLAEQLETAKQFPRASKIIIEGGGHDSFLTDAQVISAIELFLTDNLHTPNNIKIAEPAFKAL